MMFKSLRLRMPLLLLCFLVAAGGLTLLVAIPLKNRSVEAHGVEQMRRQIDLIQSGLNTILRRGNLTDVRNYLGSVKLDRMVLRALLLDAEARVVVDPDRKLEGSAVASIPHAEFVFNVERVLTTRRGEVRLRADKASVLGLYPVTRAGLEFSLQPKHSHLLYMEYDLDPQKLAERHLVFSVLGCFVLVMCGMTVLLGVILDREVTRPVQRLLKVAQDIAAGDRRVRAVPVGSSEFIALSNALNHMITALVSQQRALAARELQLRLSHEFSGTGTFEWHIARNTVRGPSRFWMNCLSETRYRPLPLAEAVKVVIPADRALFEQSLNDCAMAAAPLSVHFRCRDRDGLVHWLHLVGDAERNADGSARRIVALARDETAEVAARDQLLATTRELKFQKHALDQHTIVAITDLRGIITYVNDKACTVSGYAREALLGRSHNILKSGAHDAAFFQNLWQTISSGQVWRGELQNRRRDGSNYWVATTIVPHVDRDGRADSYIAMRTDITTRVTGENERARLRLELHQTQKTEALGLLSGGIAHDFNNLLAAILGHAELAKCRFGAVGEGRLAAYLLEITSAAERGRDLVQRLLTFSRGDSEQPQPQPLSLAAEIRDCLRLIGPLLPASIELTSELDDKAPLVLISASQLQQIVMNLCLNARDAIDVSGRLQVRLDTTHRAGKCSACGAQYRGKFVVLTVRDSGHGIPPDILARIFDPFFTTKAPGEGTGLGLSVVHGIVHQSDAHLEVSNDAAGGTRFEILWPPYASTTRQEESIALPAREHSA